MTAYATVFSDSHPDVTLIGAGAVARALALRLHTRGYALPAVISRSAQPAERLGRRVGASIVSTHFHDLPDSARLVLVCVPDDAIEEVADRLAHVPHAWEKTLVVHTSGALPASALAPLASRGARLLAFHPLQTLTADSPPEALDGVFAALEGTPQAVAAGIELAARLDLRYLVLSAEDKARYHLAASMASNFLVTLMSAVQQVLTSLDIDRATAQRVVEPLVRGTLDNLMRSTPEDALTGPIVRGDAHTVRQHGVALRRYLPHLVPLYASLAAETVPLAVRSSRLDPAHADAILKLIHQMVTIPIPTPAREEG